MSFYDYKKEDKTWKSFTWAAGSTAVVMPEATSVHRQVEPTSRSPNFCQTISTSLQSANTALTIAHLRTVDIQLD